MEDEYYPEMSSDACYETLKELTNEAKTAAKRVGIQDPELATLLSSIYIAQQNQMTILWHFLARIEKTLIGVEKKIDGISKGQTYKRKRW